MKSFIKAVAERYGYVIERRDKHAGANDEVFMGFCRSVRPFTLTSVERLNGLYRALHYVSARRIAGDFVECGVWRGGSSIFAALTLQRLGEDRRKLYLYDTFAGMSEPTAEDVDIFGRSAATLLERSGKGDAGRNVWASASLDDVKSNISASGQGGRDHSGHVAGADRGIAPRHGLVRVDPARIEVSLSPPRAWRRPDHR
jgi:O-methyltransferase